MLTERILPGRRTISSERAALYKRMDLHRDGLNEFPGGDEFYGRVTAISENSRFLNINVRPIVGADALSRAGTIIFADLLGQHNFIPLFIDHQSKITGTNIAFRLQKPGNCEGMDMASFAGDLVTTNSNSYRFRAKIRAFYDDKTIIVYQAFGDRIADQALDLQKFGDLLSNQRNTWIKPSLLWMMARSNWGNRHGQHRILAIKLLRSAFENLLKVACVANPTMGLYYKSEKEYKSEALKLKNRVQWDPDKTIEGKRRWERTIQLGVHQDNRDMYNGGIVEIREISKEAKEMRMAWEGGEDASGQLFAEVPYPTPQSLLKRLEINQYGPDENLGFLRTIVETLS